MKKKANKKNEELTEFKVFKWWNDGKNLANYEEVLDDKSIMYLLPAGHMTYREINDTQETIPYFKNYYDEDGFVTGYGTDFVNKSLIVKEEKVWFEEYLNRASYLSEHIAVMMYIGVDDIPEFCAQLVETYKGDDMGIKELRDAGYCDSPKTMKLLKDMASDVLEDLRNHWDMLDANWRLAQAYFNCNEKEKLAYLVDVLENGDEKTVAKILEGSLDKRERNDMLKVFKSHLENMRD